MFPARFTISWVHFAAHPILKRVDAEIAVILTLYASHFATRQDGKISLASWPVPMGQHETERCPPRGNIGIDNKHG